MNNPQGKQKMRWYSVYAFRNNGWLDPNAAYLVRTNAGEWRDPDLRCYRGSVVETLLQKDLQRGKPVWICELENTPDNIPVNNWC